MNLLEYLKSIFDYDKEEGKLYYRMNRGRCPAGSEAGTLHPNGYRYILIKGKSYRTHRLIWLLETGSWPTHNVDHLNRIKDDNRFSNLRDVPQRINTQNKSIRKDNKTGFAGVIKYRNKFGTKITLDGKQTCLGLYETPEEAHAVYLEAKRVFHEGANVNDKVDIGAWRRK